MKNIEFHIYKKEDYNIGQWSGGSTTELYIYPADKKYIDRDFIWRISSATVDIEESDFTALPDYDRTLIVLEGEVILAHKNKRVARLNKYEQDRFSGEYETRSYGKIVDFNLMVKKGNVGLAEVITPTEEYKELEPEINGQFLKTSQAFFCAEGYGIINFENESCMIKQGELFVVSYNTSDNIKLGLMGEGKIIRSQIGYNDNSFDNNQKKSISSIGDEAENVWGNDTNGSNEVKSKQVNKKARITGNDVKWAALLCWSNFRGGTFFFRGMRNIWKDEKLYRAIDRVEKSLITYLICLVGFAIIGFSCWEYFGENLVAPAVILWILIDIIFINPLIYVIALPRPIRSHIKNIKELNEEEKHVEELRNSDNPMANKILKKYEITGRNKYID
ncbi:MAG: HutD family protein [Aminipila sp.]